MSAPKTDSTGQIQRTNGNGNAPKGLDALLKSMQGEMARALPRHVTPDRMARVALTALRTTRGLNDCSPASFLSCVMTAAQLGLEVNTPLGQAYLIPRNAKGGGKECTIQIGYQGMLDLARRSGLVSSVYAYAVRDGDRFRYALGLEPTIEHVPADDPDREQKPITHVYAVAKIRDSDDRVFVVLTRAQVEARRARSSAAASGRGSPWDTDYEAMCLKTAVRVLYRWLPKSAEVARAVELDDSQERGAPIESAIDEQTSRALLTAGVVVEPQSADAASDAQGYNPETGEVPPSQEQP